MISNNITELSLYLDVAYAVTFVYTESLHSNFLRHCFSTLSNLFLIFLFVLEVILCYLVKTIFLNEFFRNFNMSVTFETFLVATQKWANNFLFLAISEREIFGNQVTIGDHKFKAGN